MHKVNAFEDAPVSYVSWTMALALITSSILHMKDNNKKTETHIQSVHTNFFDQLTFCNALVDVPTIQNVPLKCLPLLAHALYSGSEHFTAAASIWVKNTLPVLKRSHFVYFEMCAHMLITSHTLQSNIFYIQWKRSLL